MRPSVLPIVCFNHKGGKNEQVANQIATCFNCPAVLPGYDLSLFNPIIFVVPNTGDEEIPLPMESYLIRLTVRGLSYHLCELGNFQGTPNYVTCGRVVKRVLADLGWKELSAVRIDSYPNLDESAFKEWLSLLGDSDASLSVPVTVVDHH